VCPFDVALLARLVAARAHHNPRDFAPASGFYDGASLRLTDMLLFRDVATPNDARVIAPAS
jgi:hypothetical protein